MQAGIVSIMSSNNNTIITLSDTSGRVQSCISAGCLGFSNSRKATTQAAEAVGEAMAEKVISSLHPQISARCLALVTLQEWTRSSIQQHYSAASLLTINACTSKCCKSMHTCTGFGTEIGHPAQRLQSAWKVPVPSLGLHHHGTHLSSMQALKGTAAGGAVLAGEGAGLHHCRSEHEGAGLWQAASRARPPCLGAHHHSNPGEDACGAQRLQAAAQKAQLNLGVADCMHLLADVIALSCALANLAVALWPP